MVKDAKEEEDRIPVDVDGQMLLQTSALFGSFMMKTLPYLFFLAHL